jgi:acylphosphatase
MKRVTVWYAGRVQGVGFRATVRNLSDGRVELEVEGAERELRDFLRGIAESELSGLVAQAHEEWSAARGDLRGFTITH